MKKLTPRDMIGITISVLVVLGGLGFIIFDYLVNGIFTGAAMMVLIAVIILGIVGTIAVIRGGYKTDYYAIFILGMVFIPFGIILYMNVFIVLGIIYIIVGWMHRKQWKKKKVKK